MTSVVKMNRDGAVATVTIDRAAEGNLLRIDAERALAFGLVSAVAPLAALDRALAKLLATMTARSPEALVAVKDFLRDAPLMEPRGMAGYGANLLASVLSSAAR